MCEGHSTPRRFCRLAEIDQPLRLTATNVAAFQMTLASRPFPINRMARYPRLGRVSFFGAMV
jgi:hypothetical protein